MLFPAMTADNKVCMCHHVLPGYDMVGARQHIPVQLSRFTMQQRGQGHLVYVRQQCLYINYQWDHLPLL